MRDLSKSQSRLPMSAPPHQPRARSSGPRCRRCLPRPPAPAATAGRPFGSARRLHPRDVAVAERFLDRYVFRCTHPPRPSNLRCAAQLLPSQTRPPAQGRHHQTLPHGRAASSVCAAVPVRALLQLPLLGVIADIRVYTEVGGLLEVWEPLAPRWAPRMHVRTNIMKSGRF